MKKFNLFKMLAVLVVLITSINTAWAGNRRIYFDYSSVDMWDNDGVKMCAHCWGGSISEKNYEMKAVAGQSNLIYCDIDDRYTSVCFYRSNTVDGSWYNQTQNRSDVGTNNRFKIKNATGTYGDDNGKYLWADSDAGVRWAPGSTIDGLIDINNPHNQAFSFSGNTGTYRVNLSAHCTYQFKILEGTTAYGLDNNVFTGPISNYASNTSGYAYRLATAGAGEYVFTWDKSTKKLSISFPSVNHPSVDYCYLYDHGWGYEKQYVHVWNSGTSIAGTTWPGTKVPNQTTINEETFYYCAPGDYANFQFSDGVKNSNATNDLTTSEGYGKYQKNISSSWGWRVWSFTVTLNAQHTDEGSTNPENPSVEFNNTALSNSAGAVTPPTRPGYTFGGYWNTDACNDKMVISSTGAWQESVAGFTDGSRKWIHEGGTATLFAKWTVNSHNLTWSLDDGSITSASGTYTAAGSVNYGTALTAPTVAKEGYTFAGWSPVVPSTMPDADVSCTATWSEIKHNVTVSYQCNGKSISDNGSVTNIGISTSKSTTAPDITGYTFSSWELPSGVTTSSSLTGKTITINATADDKTIVANYTAIPQTFNGSVSGHETEWHNTGNWTSGIVPTSEHAVTIAAPVVVSTTDAVAKSIDITTGSITINADAKLVVEQSITKNSGATTEEDIFIASNSSRNGTLIWGTAGTPGKATVAYYTKSHGTGTTDDVNQYIGTPFSDEYNNYNYYGAWVFKAKSDMSAWERLPMGTKMEPFVGYNVIYNSESEGHTFIMGGTLNSNGNVTCTCSSNSYGNENLLANSWVAPIDISKFVAGDFSGVTFAIYIFNSTSEKASSGDKSPTGGNYSTFNLAASGTIPSMQSFSVCGSGSVTLDYNRLVKGGTVSNGPMHAPSRDIRAEMVSLTIHVNDENGWGDELKLFEHEDFSMDYENGWDAPKMMGYPQAPQMYAVCPEGNMAINSVPSFDNNVVAFQAGSASNEYTMSFAYDGEETLYLNDTKAAFSQEITEDKAYDFTVASGDNVARFTITKSPVYKVPTGMENTEGITNSASKLMIDGTLYIIRDGRIYNAEGSLVK